MGRQVTWYRSSRRQDFITCSRVLYPRGAIPLSSTKQTFNDKQLPPPIQTHTHAHTHIGVLLQSTYTHIPGLSKSAEFGASLICAWKVLRTAEFPPSLFGRQRKFVLTVKGCREAIFGTWIAPSEGKLVGIFCFGFFFSEVPSPTAEKDRAETMI